MPDSSRTNPSLWTRFCVNFAAASITTESYISSIFSTYIFPQFNSLRYYIYNYFNMRFITSLNQSIAFINPALITFLQLKYQTQDKDRNPFVTHPATMRIAVCGSLAYYVTFYLYLKCHFCPPLINAVAKHCMVFFGNLSVASLASMFFPDSVQPFLYVFSVLISSSELLHGFLQRIVEAWGEIYTWNNTMQSERIFDRLCRNWQNLFLERAQMLPR